MNYTCANCQKDAGIEIHKQPGYGIGLLNRIGWLGKSPVLYTGIAGEWFFYCSKPCKEAHYPGVLNERATPELQAKIKASMEQLKTELRRLGRPV